MSLSETNSCYYIYDGDCPLCKNFALTIRLRENFGNLTLIDARTDLNSPILAEVNKRNLNLDKGAVFVVGDNYYYGEDAPLVVALNSHPKGFISFINAMIFRNKLAAQIFYPIIRFMRDILLFVRGRGAIDNLKNDK